MKIGLVFLIFGILSVARCGTLMKVQLTDVPAMMLQPSPVGISVPWSFRAYANNTFLRTLMINANYLNKWQASFNVVIRGEQDSDYKCVAGDTYCTQNITTAELVAAAGFVFDTTLQPEITAGIRFEVINQTRWNSFLTDFYVASGNLSFIFSLGESADTFTDRGFRGANYNLPNWINEMVTFMTAVNVTTATGQYLVAGPGVSSSSSSWINNMSQLFTTCNSIPALVCIFTLHMNFFQNDTDCSIDNMLSQTYLQTRMNQVFGAVRNEVTNYLVTISRMKLHYGNGIDGKTNTFAAALWAADFIFNWMYIGGFQIAFDTDMTGGSFQSPFTSSNNLAGAPALQVTPIYYAMLLHPLLANRNGQSTAMTVTQNLYKGPHNIKVYSYRLIQSEMLGAIIINKDTNSTLSGEVQICFATNRNATYYYLEADSHLQKTKIRFQGYSLNTSFTGTFEAGRKEVFSIAPDQNGCFNIPIKYSQIAKVELQDSLPTVSKAEFDKPSFDGRMLLGSLLLIALLFF